MINQRVAQAIKTVELEDRPIFAIYAWPVTDTVVPELFARRDSAVLAILQNPPQLRRNGFDLETNQEPRIVEAQFRQALIKKYKIVDFWRDGTLTFVATGDENFLCWGKRKWGSGPVRINPISLIEATYLFCETVRQLFHHTEPQNPPFRIAISLRNILQGDKFCGLIPGGVGTIDWQLGSHPLIPPGPEVTVGEEWRGGEAAPDLLAFLLVREIYAWYGLEYEDIPYTKNIEGKVVVDIDPFRSF